MDWNVCKTLVMGSEVFAEMFSALACSARKEIIIPTMHHSWTQILKENCTSLEGAKDFNFFCPEATSTGDNIKKHILWEMCGIPPTNERKRVNRGRKLECPSQERPVTHAGKRWSSVLLPQAGWTPSSLALFKSIWVLPISNPYLVCWTSQLLPASCFGFLLPPDSYFCLATILQKIELNVMKTLTFCFLGNYYVF